MLTRFFPRIDRFRCPGDQQLAAYVDQQLIGAGRQRVESHLAKCNPCMEQVGFLVRQANAGAAEAPAWLVQKAAQLQAAPARNTFGKTWKWAPVAAGVAAVALGLTLWLRTHAPEPAPAPLIASAPAPGSPTGVTPAVSSPPDTAVRNTAARPSAPVILSPQPGATVDSAGLVFRWEPLPGAVAYEVRVVTADGDVVWEKKVNGTSVTPPRSVSLTKGNKYFLWVRAVFADGKTQQSDPVGFTAG